MSEFLLTSIANPVKLQLAFITRILFLKNPLRHPLGLFVWHGEELG